VSALVGSLVEREPIRPSFRDPGSDMSLPNGDVDADPMQGSTTFLETS